MLGFLISQTVPAENFPDYRPEGIYGLIHLPPRFPTAYPCRKEKISLFEACFQIAFFGRPHAHVLSVPSISTAPEPDESILLSYTLSPAFRDMLPVYLFSFVFSRNLSSGCAHLRISGKSSVSPIKYRSTSPPRNRDRNGNLNKLNGKSPLSTKKCSSRLFL